MSPVVTIESDELSIAVLPGKGADIHAIVDRRTGVDVLFKTPWGGFEDGLPGGDSKQDWLARYGGGWQQLVPNAGEARPRGGTTQGYHGEAALRSWTVVSADPAAAAFEVELATAPCRLERRLRVEGPTLHITDIITNLAAHPTPVCWVQHPAFGAPFIDGRARIATGARTVLADAEDAGSLADGTVSAFPMASGRTGEPVDLRVVPGRDDVSAVFATLTDFDGGWFAIDSPSCGFGVGMAWDTGIFPHAWLWQECHATAAYPWFGRAYVAAIEPANVLAGNAGPSALGLRGDPPSLAPHASWHSELALCRYDLTGAVTRVDRSGRVYFDDETGKRGIDS